MNKSTSSYPTLSVDATGSGIVSHAGAVTLLRTAEVTGLTAALSEQLSPWRKPLAQFDPGKVIADLAVSLALGGDCLADIATLREHAAAWEHAGQHAPDHNITAQNPIVIDLDPCYLAFREGIRCSDLQTRLWISSADGVRRSRHRRDR